MNDGGRYSIQSPFVSNLPPAWSTLPPPITDVRYCQYDVPHKDYIYTDGWVELLVSKLADPIKFAEILGKEPEKLSQEAA